MNRPVIMLLLALLLLMSLLPLPHSRIIGFHVDEERCSGNLDQPPGPNNRSTQTALCTAFLDQLHNLSALMKLHSVGLPKPLTLSVDAGTWMACPADAPPAPAAGSCFNLSYQGESKPIAAHVVDVADRTVLMDYDADPAKVVSRALPFLSYADSIRKSRSVVVGLAVAAPGTPVLWWQAANESALEQLMATLQPTLSHHPSFGGFSVFDSVTWEQCSATAAPHQSPLPAGMAFHPTATWYADHSMVLNATRRAEWLRWAQSRGVTSVFIAAHASNVDLIPVPGIEGSSANEAAFCTFVQQADMRGISVELFNNGDPEIPGGNGRSGWDLLDLRFAEFARTAHNCSAVPRSPPAPPRLKADELPIWPSPAKSLGVPLKRGWNLGNTLEGCSPSKNPNDEWVFETVAEAGFDWVRIPAQWGCHARVDPPYTIDAVFLAQVNQTVGWALKHKLRAMINTHHENNWIDTPNVTIFDAALPRLVAIWAQIARAFAAYSDDVLVFELFNEPKLMSVIQLNQMNAALLPPIRATNPTRQVHLGGLANMNSGWILSHEDAMVFPKVDKHLALTVHSYDPWSFAGSSGPPPTHAPTAHSFDAAEYGKVMQGLKTWSFKHSIPVYLDECGCTVMQTNRTGRLEYYKVLRVAAEEAGVGWAIWDDDGWWKTLDRRGNRTWDSGVLTALGLHAPTSTTRLDDELAEADRDYTDGMLLPPPSVPASPIENNECHDSILEARMWVRQQLAASAASVSASSVADFATIRNNSSQRQLVTRSQPTAIVVQLCPGQLDAGNSTPVFTAADSGHENLTIIYRGAQQSSRSRTTLDLGVRIRGWQPDEVAGGGIWSARIPSSVKDSRQLWIGGIRAIRARSEGLISPIANTSATWITNVSYIHVASNLSLCAGMEFVFRPACASWTEPRCQLDAATRLEPNIHVRGHLFTLQMESPCFRRYQTRARMTTSSPTIFPVWVENALSLLDSEREWFADFHAHKIYYKPTRSEDLRALEAVLGGSLHGNSGGALELAGAHHLEFEDIDFQFQTWQLPAKIGFVDSQSGFYRSYPATQPEWGLVPRIGLPAALQLHGCHHIAIRRCSFSHLGLGGVLTDASSQNITITGNSFQDLSAFGVSLGNVTNASLPPSLQDSNLQLVNNSISDVAVEFTGCAGIFAGYASRVNISHNVVANVSNCGICVGWGWGVKNTMHSNSIMHNHVFRSNTVLKDTGSIYTISSQPYSEIAYNYLQNQVLLYGSLYHDQGSGDFYTHHNVVEGGPMWLYLQRAQLGGVHDITVSWNYFTDGDDATPGGCALAHYNPGCDDATGTCAPRACANATVKCCANVTVANNTKLLNSTDWPVEASRIVTAAGVLL